MFSQQLPIRNTYIDDERKPKNIFLPGTRSHADRERDRLMDSQTISFVMSVSPHGTIRFTQDRFSWNLSKKSKGHPQQAEVAQGVPGRLRPRIFLTFQHYEGGGSSAIGTGRLYPKINLCYSLSEAELTSGQMVISGEPRKKSQVTPPEIDPGTVRLVVQCLNHYATPGSMKFEYFSKFCQGISSFVKIWQE